MFRGIFNKRAAQSKAGGPERRPSGAVSSALPRSASQTLQATAPASSEAPRLDLAVDAEMLAASRELSGLASMQASQAAKERGWAALQRELDKHPVRPAAPRTVQPARKARTHGRRWALGSVAAAVAVVAALLGTYSGGLLQTADNGDHSTTVTSVVTSDSTEPVTTDSIVTTVSSGATVTSGGSGATGSIEPTSTVNSGSVVTESTGATGTTPTTQSTGPGTTGGSTGGTTPATSGPNTTKPTSPSTTSGQQYTASQRASSAQAAAIYLAQLVITGNTSGARELVDPEAQSSLAQMIMWLNEPYDYAVVGNQALGADIQRVTIAINDRVDNGSGELVETVKGFVLKVRVDSKGAVIIAINAGS